MSERIYDFPPMPPEPVGASVPAERTGGMSRQEFLRLGGLSLIGAYLGNSVFATYLQARESKIWPENEPSFNFLNGETYTGQDRLGIFLPGFGDMHSETEAQLWNRTSELPKGMLTGYVDYSNEGIPNLKTIVSLIKDSVDMDRIKSVTMFGRSIGGLFALPVAAELGKPVKSLVLCSSPDKLEHGDYGNFGWLVAKVPENQEVATLGKWGVQAWREYSEKGGILRSIEAGWHDTFTGANPIALQNELKTAVGINIWDKDLDKKLRHVFIPGYSNVAYASTDHPSSDKTVLVVVSARGFVRRFADLGVTCTVHGLPYDGHADVEVTATNLKAWSQAAQAPHPLASK